MWRIFRVLLLGLVDLLLIWFHAFVFLPKKESTNRIFLHIYLSIYEVEGFCLLFFSRWPHGSKYIDLKTFLLTA